MAPQNLTLMILNGTTICKLVHLLLWAMLLDITIAEILCRYNPTKRSERIACHKLSWFYQNSLKCLKKRGKGLINKAESMKEFATQTHIKYATCMDLLLEGDRLKPGEINPSFNFYMYVCNFYLSNGRFIESPPTVCTQQCFKSIYLCIML